MNYTFKSKFNGQDVETHIVFAKMENGVTLTFGDPSWNLVLSAVGTDLLKLQNLLSLWAEFKPAYTIINGVNLNNLSFNFSNASIMIEAALDIMVIKDIVNSINVNLFPENKIAEVQQEQAPVQQVQQYQAPVQQEQAPVQQEQAPVQQVQQYQAPVQQEQAPVQHPLGEPQPLTIPNNVVRVDDMQQTTSDQFGSMLQAPTYMQPQQVNMNQSLPNIPNIPTHN